MIRFKKIFLLNILQAYSIGHGFHGAEGPARAAGSLVADLVDGGAVRPLLPGIELLGNVVHFLVEIAQDFLLVRQGELVGIRMDAHQATDVLLRHALVKVTSSLVKNKENNIICFFFFFRLYPEAFIWRGSTTSIFKY